MTAKSSMLTRKTLVLTTSVNPAPCDSTTWRRLASACAVCARTPSGRAPSLSPTWPETASQPPAATPGRRGRGPLMPASICRHGAATLDAPVCGAPLVQHACAPTVGSDNSVCSGWTGQVPPARSSPPCHGREAYDLENLYPGPHRDVTGYVPFSTSTSPGWAL